MHKLTKYIIVLASLAVVLAPSLALAAPIVQPTVPVPGGQITESTIRNLIESIVNFLITISIVIAVGYLVWGGIQFVRGDVEGGKGTLKNGVIGVAIILGVGLILNTIAGFINRGGTLN
jgi:hypothetical protein